MSDLHLPFAQGNPLRVPGYLSVKAAAAELGIGERSVRGLIERHRLSSVRLGRMHFIPTRMVYEYGVARRLRLRRAHRRIRRARQRAAR